MADQLFRVNTHSGEVDFQLAESAEVSEDGLEINITIRSAKWHDKPPVNGADVTAEDVAFSLERQTGKFDDPGNVGRYLRRSLFTDMDRAEAVDDRTVRITMARPNSGLVRAMADHRVFMVPEAGVEHYGDFNKVAARIGSGPLVLEEFEDNRFQRYSRNEAYRVPEQPYVDGMETTAIPDLSSQASALLSEQIHMLDVRNKTIRDTILSSRPDIQIAQYLHPFWPAVVFNMMRDPWTDPRVREAIFLTIDGPPVMDGYFGADGWAPSGPLPITLPDAIPSEDIGSRPGYRSPTEEDLSKAHELLDAAGFPNGQGLVMNFVHSASSGSFDGDLAIQLEDQLSRQLPDIAVELASSDSATITSRRTQGDFDTIFNGVLSLPEPQADLLQNYSTDGSRNYGSFSDSEVDETLAKVGAALDEEERSELLLDVQEQIIAAKYSKVLGNQLTALALVPELKGFVVPGSFAVYNAACESMLQIANLWLADE